MKNALRYAFLTLLAPWVLVSCSPPPAQTSPSFVQKESAFPSEATSIGVSPKTMNFQGKGYTFTLPESGWGLVSDPQDPEAPLEFFNAQRNLRAVLTYAQTSADANAADLARLETQVKETGAPNTVCQIANNFSWKGAEGSQWNCTAPNLQLLGWITVRNGHSITALLQAGDKQTNTKQLAQEWKIFFNGLTFANDFQGSALPAVDPATLTSFSSPSLGYTWSTKNTIWHKWNAIAIENTDPELALTDTAEEVSLFLLGAYVPQQDLSMQEMFDGMLGRLGLDPESQGLQVLRRADPSGKSGWEFSTAHTVEGFDFVYRGKFLWQDGMGVMAIAWTQGALAKKYSDLLVRSVQGLQWKSVGTPDEHSVRLGARIVNQIGLRQLQQQQPLVALAFFEKANKLDMSEPLYLVNCGFVYQQKDLQGPGVRHFEGQMELVRRSGKLLGILGEMYEELRDYGAARRYYELALEFTPNDPELTINLSDALWGLGQRTLSLEVVRNLHAKQPSSRLGVYVAKTMMGMDQYAEAVDFLQEVRKQFGLSSELGIALTDALGFLARHQESMAVSGELLNKEKGDWEIWLAHGKAEFHLRQFRNAEVSFNKVLALKPGNDEARSFLSATKAFMGKADVRALQNPITPVFGKPIQLSPKIDSAMAAQAKAEEYPALIHFHEEWLRAQPHQSWTRTEHMLVEILDPRGIGLFGEFSFTFLPGYDRLHINTLEILDRNLQVKHKWSLREAYITNVTGQDASLNAQRAHLPLTGLAVGDYIYLQVSRTSIANQGSIPFVHFMASREVPIGSSRFRLLADTARVMVEEYGPISSKTVEGGKEWLVTSPIVIRKEQFMPAYRDFGAGFLMAPKQQWEDVGREYLGLIRHQVKNPIAVREKAFEVLGSKRLDTNSLWHLIDWVRQNITYREVEFGGHSIIPNPSQVTLTDRKGDCKDQSLLLHEMLTAIGVPSHLALIHLQEPGSIAMPTILQFNHMILYIPPGKSWPAMWIDPTDKAGSRRPVPIDLEGKVSLILDPDSAKVDVTPILENHQEHRAHLEHILYFDADGSAQFRDSLSLEGKFASVVRNELLSRDKPEQLKYFGSWLEQQIPDAHLVSLRADNIQDFTKPLRLVLSYESKRYFGQSAQGIQGQFPSLWERSFMKLPKLRKRHHPIRIPHETHFSVAFKLEVPSDSRIVFGSATTPHEFQYLTWAEAEQPSSGNKVEWNAQWTTFSLFAEPSEYEVLRKDWDQVLERVSPLLLLQKR